MGMGVVPPSSNIEDVQLQFSALRGLFSVCSCTLSTFSWDSFQNAYAAFNIMGIIHLNQKVGKRETSRSISCGMMI